GHVAIRSVGILVHRPISERIETVAAVATNRQPVWTHSRQVIECRRVIPGTESKLACVCAAAISANAECSGARSLCAKRPVQIRRFCNHEYAIPLREDLLRSVWSIHRYSVKHGRPQDNLFDRFDREASADRRKRKNRRSLLVAP